MFIDLPNGTHDDFDIYTGTLIKRVSDWYMLNGSLNWNFATDYANFKRVYIPNIADMAVNIYKMLKFNGDILVNSATWDAADKTNNSNAIYLTIADRDSGWADSLTPSNAEIKAYFYGWKMCNSDGVSPWLKNETPYNPNTWAEWTKTAGVVGDGTGLEFTYNNPNVYAYLPNTQFKGSTKYGLLFNIVSNTAIIKYLQLGGELSGVYPNIVAPSQVGNTKYIFTTQATIPTNRALFIQNSAGDIGSKVKIKDIRFFELPAGSQIESDFNSMTADQLVLKYGFYGQGTKYWKHITDDQGLTNVIPTSSYFGYTPYKMAYQLAAPITTVGTPIKTNWSSEDYYNYGDLNRVESNTNIIADMLEIFSRRPTLGNIITNRDNTSYEFFDSLNRLENNILILKNSSFEPPGWVIPKTDWKSLDPLSYIDANRFENNLLALYSMINNVKDYFKYSGQYGGSYYPGQDNTYL